MPTISSSAGASSRANASISVPKFLSGTRRPTLMILKPFAPRSRRRAERFDVGGLQRDRDPLVADPEGAAAARGRPSWPRSTRRPAGPAGGAARAASPGSIESIIGVHSVKITYARRWRRHQRSARSDAGPYSETTTQSGLASAQRALQAARPQHRGAAGPPALPGAQVHCRVGVLAREPVGRHVPARLARRTGRSRRSRAPGARSARGTTARGRARAWAGRWRSAGPWPSEGYGAAAQNCDPRPRSNQIERSFQSWAIISAPPAAARARIERGPGSGSIAESVRRPGRRPRRRGCRSRRGGTAARESTGDGEARRTRRGSVLYLRLPIPS